MLCSRKHRDCQTTCLGCSQVAVRSEVGPAWRSKCAGRQHMQNECSGPVMVQHGSAGTTTRHVSQQAGSHAVRTSGSHACAYRTVWLAAMLCKQDGLASTSSPQEACKLGPGSQGLSRHQIASAASRPPPACLPVGCAKFPVAALRPAAMLGLASHLHAWGILPSLSLCHQAVIHLAHPVWQVRLVPAHGGAAAMSNC